MWFLGAVLGGLVGGILGWSVGSRARQRQDERDRLIDERLQRLERLLARQPQPSPLPTAAASVPLAPATACRETRPVDVAGAAAVEAPVVAAATGAPAVTPSAAQLPPAAEVPDVGARQVADQPAASATPVRLAGQAPPGAPPAPAPDRLAALRDWLLRGNLMARAGVIVLFFGVAFLLKYSYQHLQVPLELRLTGVALAAVVLLRTP